MPRATRNEGRSYRREISHISHFWPTWPDVAKVGCEIFVNFTRANLRPPIAVSPKFHNSSTLTRCNCPHSTLGHS